MEIRALHCSDIHLDGKFPLTPGRGEQRRQETRELFTEILETARGEKVDVVLIAGDLFDHSLVSPGTIAFIKEKIKALDPLPVVIAPGNKDPFTADSPYSYSDWPPNTIIFNTNRLKAIEIKEKKLVIHGAANKSGDDSYPIMKSFAARKKEFLQILMFHGTDTEIAPAGKTVCLPFSGSELAQCPVNYIALGHLHDYRRLSPGEGNSCACYCGAPDFRSFHDTGEKGIIVARITQEGTETRLLPAFKRRYFTLPVECSPAETSEKLLERVRTMAKEKDWSSSVVRIVLTGSISPSLAAGIKRIRDDLAPHFFGVSVFNEAAIIQDMKSMKGSPSTLTAFVGAIEKRMERAGREELLLLAESLSVGIEAFSPQESVAQ
ncbi:MAG: metallophosphoesterase [Candidatus Eremiobacteraeota bacterium]|nr:metallophosphoesterase [Candidatus Eremiobacteraeota bacterium]